ncbi:hypothetical protein [Actinomadura macrotermitis]|uniref:hypothetical protein n=1 Tax=Actinomadura macrotermitis TaxID=2585200 RepID=UPI001295F8F1|nr:hypothetical protein [Actinomadura macrotermitis]
MTAFRPGPRADDGPGDLLGHACALVRLCARDAMIAATLLALVVVGVTAQLAAGRTGVLALVSLTVVGAAFSVAASCVLRARRTLVTALGAVRGRTGAPLDPGVPWTPFALGTALDNGVRDVELRRLLAAAHRCCELSWQAVNWAVITSGLCLLWTALAGSAG